MSNQVIEITSTPIIRQVDISTNVDQQLVNIDVVKTTQEVKVEAGEVNFETPPGGGPVSDRRWIDYVVEYEFTESTEVDGGSVLEYQGLGETVYRLVPSPYDLSQDAIYSNFDGVTVSNLIVSRRT